MKFGNAIAKACSTFALTNIDDLFVLVTFFALAAAGKTTPWKITLGQYLGFTVIIAISMVGFAAALVLPAEPIGFLGLVPVCLGVWGVLGLLLLVQDGDAEEGGEGEGDEMSKTSVWSQVGSVALVTVTNGGDNVSTYTPLFAQAGGAEVAVYVVTYYILLGTWIFVAFLIMKQRCVLALAKRYARWVIPWLYVGLGVYIVVTSECYPWSVRKINAREEKEVGGVILGVVTAVVLGVGIGCMVWAILRRKVARQETGKVGGEETAAVDSRALERSSGDGSWDTSRTQESRGCEYPEIGPERVQGDTIDMESSRGDYFRGLKR